MIYYIIFVFVFSCLFLHVVRRKQIVLFRVWKWHSIRSFKMKFLLWSELWLLGLPFLKSCLKSPMLLFCIRWLPLRLESWYIRTKTWVWESKFNSMVLYTWTQTSILNFSLILCYHQNIIDIIQNPFWFNTLYHLN